MNSSMSICNDVNIRMKEGSDLRVLRGGKVFLMAETKSPLDVLIVGGGNAGLCTAITTRCAGARMLLLESATKDLHNGNNRHTRNIRTMHKAATAYLTGPYEKKEF